MDYSEKMDALLDGLCTPAPRWNAWYAALSTVERDMVLVTIFSTEVECGGYQTYFTNSSGLRWREALDSLRRVNWALGYEALALACACFPGGRPSDDIEAFGQFANSEEFEKVCEEIGDFLQIDDWAEALETYWSDSQKQQSN